MLRTDREALNCSLALASSAGITIDEIRQQIIDLYAMIEAIMRAVGEQSAGVGEINSVVNTLDNLTSGNSDRVVQSSSATDALMHLATRLSERYRRTG